MYRILEVDLSEENNLILKLDELYDACDKIIEECENDQQFIGNYAGQKIITLLANQTELTFKYTKILSDVTAMKKLLELYLKSITRIIQKNIQANSQRALGDREIARLIDGDPKIVEWTQHLIQVEQYENTFKMLNDALRGRGYQLKSIADLHINEKNEMEVG